MALLRFGGVLRSVYAPPIGHTKRRFLKFALARVLHGYAATARGDPPTHGRAHDHARGERGDRPGQSAGGVVGVSAVGEDVRDAIEWV